MSRLPKTVDDLRGIGLKSMFTAQGVRADGYDAFAALDTNPEGRYAKGLDNINQGPVYGTMTP